MPARAHELRGAAAALAGAAVLALTGCGDGSGATADPGADATAGSGTPPSKASPDLETADATSYPTQTKKACQLLTVAVARSVLGDVGPAAAPPPAASSAKVNVTSCVRANTLAGRDRAGSAILLLRVARNAAGARSNASVFADGSEPRGAQPVEGYGEKAFWNPAFGQLNILDQGNWYILSVGPVDPKKHTLAETEELADALADQF